MKRTTAATHLSLADDEPPCVLGANPNQYIWKYKGADIMFVILGPEVRIRLHSIGQTIQTVQGDLNDAVEWMRKNF